MNYQLKSSNLSCILFVFLTGFPILLFSSSDPFDNAIKVGNIMTSWKADIGSRSERVYMPETFEDGQDAELRSMYGIERDEIIAGAFDNTWWGAVLAKHFDKGVVFTDSYIYIRNGENDIQKLKYLQLQLHYKIKGKENDVLIRRYSVLTSEYSNRGEYKISVQNSEIKSAEMAILIDDISYALSDVDLVNKLMIKRKDIIRNFENSLKRKTMPADRAINMLFLQTHIATNYLILEDLYFYIGFLYASSDNNKKAKEYYRKASLKGHEIATYKLGRMW